MSWTDERVERLSTLWLEGRSASQIATELGEGVSRNAVIGKVHRLGLSGRVLPLSMEQPSPLQQAADLGPPAEALLVNEAPPEVSDSQAAISDIPAPEIRGSEILGSQILGSEVSETTVSGTADDGIAPENVLPKPAAPAAIEGAATAAPIVPDAVGTDAVDLAPPVPAPIAAVAPEPIRFDVPTLRAPKDVVIPISGRVTILELSAAMCRWPIGDPTSAEFRFCGCRAVSTLPYCQEHARVAFQPVADRRRSDRLIRIA